MPATTAIYRGMDRAALDAAYDNTGAVADSHAYRERWWNESSAIRAKPSARLDLRFGARPRATLDYFPSGTADAPLFVFIHGGYWQRNEKERFSFLVPGPRAHGIDVAVPGYTLAPEARLADIIAEVRQALDFLADRSGELGFDRSRLIVGGWSAGGHLTAAVANHPAVRGGIPISGIFDPRADLPRRAQRQARARGARGHSAQPACELWRPLAAARIVRRRRRTAGAWAPVAGIRRCGAGARPAGQADGAGGPPPFLDPRRTGPPRRRNHPRARHHHRYTLIAAMASQ
jgi:acetyl esterase/lipase